MILDAAARGRGLESTPNIEKMTSSRVVRCAWYGLFRVD